MFLNSYVFKGSSVFVIQQEEPIATIITVRDQPQLVGDYFLTFSVIMVVLSFCCGLPCLTCTVAALAIILNVNAKLYLSKIIITLCTLVLLNSSSGT